MISLLITAANRSNYSSSSSLLCKFLIFTSDKGGGKCFYPCLPVCLSVSEITQKTRAWIWMKCCVSTDVGTWTNWLTFEPDPDYSPEPDCFLRYRLSAATRNFTSGKSHVYVLATAARRGFNMVLFTEPVSRRNTFVGGTCAPPSALLVLDFFPSTSNHSYSSLWNPEISCNFRRYQDLQFRRQFVPRSEFVLPWD